MINFLSNREKQWIRLLTFMVITTFLCPNLYSLEVFYLHPQSFFHQSYLRHIRRLVAEIRLEDEAETIDVCLDNYSLIRVGQEFQFLFLNNSPAFLLGYPTAILLTSSIETQIGDKWEVERKAAMAQGIHYLPSFKIQGILLERVQYEAILGLLRYCDPKQISIQVLCVNPDRIRRIPPDEWSKTLREGKQYVDDLVWIDDLVGFLTIGFQNINNESDHALREKLKNTQILIIGSGLGYRKEMIKKRLPLIPRENIVELDLLIDSGINPTVRADASSLPFLDNSFDVVIDPGVRCYRVVSPETGLEIIKEVHRVLKPQTLPNEATGLYLAFPWAPTVLNPEKPLEDPWSFFDRIGFWVESLLNPKCLLLIDNPPVLCRYNLEYYRLIKRNIHPTQHLPIAGSMKVDNPPLEVGSSV